MSAPEESLVRAAPAPPVFASTEVVVSSRALSPRETIGQLKPRRIIDLLDMTIYELQKDAKRDERGKRTIVMATITVKRGASTFKLSYYPDDGDVQIVKDLPFSQLAAAVEDLKGAGF